MRASSQMWIGILMRHSMQKPLKGAVLYALDVPPNHGDTAWVNLYLAYELLYYFQRLCSSLTAVHDNFHALSNVLDTYPKNGLEKPRHRRNTL